MSGPKVKLSYPALYNIHTGTDPKGGPSGLKNRLLSFRLKRYPFTVSPNNGTAPLFPISFCFLILFTISCSASPQLELKIKLADKIENRNIVNVLVTFENKGIENLNLYGFRRKVQVAMCKFINFEIIFNNEDTLVCDPAGAIPKIPHKNDSIMLAPDSIHTEIINLTSFYRSSHGDDIPIWDTSAFWGTRMWSPGMYVLHCSYEYSDKGRRARGVDLWQGSVSSNEIVFTLSK